MQRIFAGMSLWAGIFLIASIVLGFLVQGGGEKMGWHIQLGLLTASYIILLHSVVFVHLLGTGLGIKRAIFEHRMPEEAVYRQLHKMKMTAYPPAFLCMVLTIMLAVAGGAVQTGALPAMAHRILAFVVVLANLITIPLELKVIGQNRDLMDDLEATLEQAAAAPAPKAQNQDIKERSEA